MTITLLELRTQSRQRADMESSTFIADTELNNYINNSIAELYDILIQSYDGEYFINTFEFTTTANEDLYNLPSDFYKLRGIDAKINGNQFFEIQPFNFNERNRFDNAGAWSLLGQAAIRYRLIGSQVRFSPIPDAGVDIKIWYIPLSIALTLDADTFNDINMFSEYVITDAAIKMMQKEESDVTVLLTQKAALKRRIEESSRNRDAGHPQSVSDIHAEGFDFRFFGGGGN